MKEFSLLICAIILVFIGFVVYWNKKWQANILDEREVLIRLKVRKLIAKAVEISLVLGILFHIEVQSLSGMQALLLVGIPALMAEGLGNWYLRRDSHGMVE